MQSTKSLSSLKRVFTQPLPLNKRSSQKLLDSITKSFRAQLDREHGWTVDSPHDLSASAPPISYLPSAPTPATSDKTDASSPYTRPTDRHMRGILDNPLFSYNAAHYTPAKNPGHVGTDPKLIFEAAVAKGLMTIPRAHGFLIKVQDNIQQSAAPSVRKAMKESGAGLLVLQWLRASGQERSLAFLENKAFTKILLSFMAAEGVDDLAWVWIERMAAQDGRDAVPSWPMQVSSLLHTLVAAKSNNTVELDSAYKLLLQGVDLFKQKDVPLSKVDLAWRGLAWETTGHSWRHALPAQDLYEAFLGVLPPSPELKMHHAHLQLYHPTDPSANSAIAYLDDETNWKSKTVDSLNETKTQQSGIDPLYRFGEVLASLTLDTVQHLTQKGNVRQAQDIFDHVQPYLKNFVKPDFAY